MATFRSDARTREDIQMRALIRKVEFDIEAPDGTRYWPRVIGEEEGHVWRGYVELTPIGAGDVLVTGHETTQTKRSDLDYWAQGLERVFFEGALERAWRGTYAARRAGPDATDAAFLATLTTLEDMGDLQRAIVIARRVLVASPEQPDALWVLAVAHAQRGDRGAAKTCLDRFLAAAPADDVRRKRGAKMLAKVQSALA
jgi:hypothetical protein